MKTFNNIRGLLDRRPNIQYVEPAQIPTEQKPASTKESTIEDRHEETKTIISQYKRLEALYDLAQQRIDSRVKKYKTCLDPQLDAGVIQSLKRQFGNVEPCITYEQYKACLTIVASAGQKVAVKITEDDLRKAASDSLNGSIGGFTETPGGLRPELQFQSPVKPIDQEQFQKDSINKLFKMMLPMLSEMSDAKILQHLLSAPHSS